MRLFPIIGRAPQHRTTPATMPASSHGDLELPGALQRTISLVARPTDSLPELVLLHANHRRLQLLVNLASQLAALGIRNTLALGWSETLCRVLARAELPIHCAHSSYLRTGPLAAAAERLLPHKHVAWLQRFYYLRRLLELRVRVLALDTDIAVRADPFIALRDPALLGRHPGCKQSTPPSLAHSEAPRACLDWPRLGGRKRTPHHPPRRPPSARDHV